MKGQEISEDEVVNLIYLSEKSNRFSKLQFLKSLFYHLCSTFLTFPLTCLIMFILEGGNLNLANNLQFCGWGDPARKFTFFLYTVYTIHLYFVYRWYQAGKTEENF